MSVSNFEMSPHFTFYELTKTGHSHLQEKNREVVNNYHLMSVGYGLCYMLLEPIRKYVNAPVYVNSAYRCEELNTRVGGSSSSQHLLFEAADIRTPYANLTQLWKWIWQDSSLEFGQLILEGYQPQKPTWIHISLGAPWRDANKCGQVFTWDSKNDYQFITQV